MSFPDVYVPIAQQAISMLLYLKTSYYGLHCCLKQVAIIFSYASISMCYIASINSFVHDVMHQSNANKWVEV
jgi:hypothetical protein